MRWIPNPDNAVRLRTGMPTKKDLSVLFSFSVVVSSTANRRDDGDGGANDNSHHFRCELRDHVDHTLYMCGMMCFPFCG